MISIHRILISSLVLTSLFIAGCENTVNDADLIAKSKELENIQVQLAEAEETIQALTEKNDKLSQEVAAANAHMKTLESENKSLETEKKKTQTSLSTAVSHFIELQTSLQKTQQGMNELKERFKTLAPEQFKTPAAKQPENDGTSGADADSDKTDPRSEDESPQNGN